MKTLHLQLLHSIYTCLGDLSIVLEMTDWLMDIACYIYVHVHAQGNQCTSMDNIVIGHIKPDDSTCLESF